MRISGMVSGFDTDEMVKSMMAMERFKVDRFEKTKQTTLWRQESYNTMNKAFANFILNTQKDMGLKKTSNTGLITSGNYKNVDYIKKATSSNEAAATVTSSSKAVNGSYKIDVEQLAQGASLSSAKFDENILAGMDELKFDITLGKDKLGKDIKQTIEVKNSNGITMDDIIKSINNSKVQMFEGNIVVDGKVGEVTVDKAKIKEVSLGVSAFYDKVNNTLFMQSKETGKNGEIQLTSIEPDLPDSKSTKFISALNGSGDNKMISNEGNDAEIKFNGVKLEYSSNKINLNGLDIELKGITTVEVGGVTSTNPISINVSTNTEGIMEKVQKLVNDYNDLVDLSSKALSEKAYPGYQPLTSEERKAMSDDDVKLWDEKAKSGLLNRDETITRTLQNIRNDLYKTVEGLDPEFNHITKIGITTEKYSRGSAGGKLEIDMEKLKNAIEANPDAVMDLLFKESNDKPEDSQKTTKGIFTNIYDNLITGMKSIVDKSGPGQDSDLLRGVKSNLLIDFVTKKSSISDLDKAVQDMNRQIDNLNVLLAKKEDSYYAKFTAMEKNLHKMSGQSGWLQQQFG